MYVHDVIHGMCLRVKAQEGVFSRDLFLALACYRLHLSLRKMPSHVNTAIPQSKCIVCSENPSSLQKKLSCILFCPLYRNEQKRTRRS